MKPSLSRRLFSTIQRSLGADIEKRLHELQDSQWLSHSELQQMQWRKLTKLLHNAYKNVPYYRRTWQEAGIHPSDIRSWDDFKKVPFLTKGQVRENHSEMLSKEIKRMSLHHDSTGGSSGTPLRFVRPQDTKAWFWAAQYRGYGWFGIQLDDRQGRFYGMPFGLVSGYKARMIDWVMNRRRISAFDMRDEQMRAFAQQMNRFRPVYLNGYAMAIGRFAEFMSREKNRARYTWIPLKGVVSTSEVLTPTYKRLIEEVFECPVINEYGAAEIGLVAITCPKGGFHVVCENVYLETIPAIDVELPPNVSSGPVEIVITDLHNYAMPFIRYKVGDLLKAAPDERLKCDCGRGSLLIGSVIGRDNSLVVTPEGKVLSGMVFDYLARYSLMKESGIRQFVARQDALDRITYYIVKDDHFSDSTLKYLSDTTRQYLGPSIIIDMKFVSQIPLTNKGKFMNFSSTLNVNEVLTRICYSKKSDKKPACRD
ncbi:MAG: hypothetical protein ABII09_09670 [Planctomycetota bacterium]